MPHKVQDDLINYIAMIHKKLSLCEYRPINNKENNGVLPSRFLCSIICLTHWPLAMPNKCCRLGS